MNDKTYRVKERVLKLPRAADKGQQIKYALRRRRKQKKKWEEPDDAYLILNLHFTVLSFSRQSFNAEACLEIPVKEGFQYYTVSAGAHTRAGALRRVIQDMENSFWFRHMKEKKIYFRVTGEGMEELYRGYL